MDYGGLLRLFPYICQYASVDVEDVAVDKIGGGGGEEQGGAFEVGGRSPAGGGGFGDDEVVKGMSRFAEGGCLGRSYIAGADAVDLDVVRCPFAGEVAGQHLQASLGGGVGADCLAPQFAHHGAYIDDLSASLGDHAGGDGLGDDEGGGEVNVDDLTEVGGGHFNGGDALDYAGIVYEDVYRADFSADLGYEGVNGGFVGYVAYIAAGLYAVSGVGGNAFIDKLACEVVENYGCACFGEGLGYCIAYAVGGAGDEGCFSGQVELVHGVLS